MGSRVNRSFALAPADSAAASTTDSKCAPRNWSLITSKIANLLPGDKPLELSGRISCSGKAAIRSDPSPFCLRRCGADHSAAVQELHPLDAYPRLTEIHGPLPQRVRFPREPSGDGERDVRSANWGGVAAALITASNARASTGPTLSDSSCLIKSPTRPVLMASKSDNPRNPLTNSGIFATSWLDAVTGFLRSRTSEPMLVLPEHQPYSVNKTACHMGYSSGS